MLAIESIYRPAISVNWTARAMTSPAFVRFLSIEPLLEELGPFDLSSIGWVIVGGESGAGARPIRPEWVRSIREQCQRAGVPFFFKQWGGRNKKKSGPPP